MAKVSCNYITKIKEMDKTTLSQPVVFVIDMINGFVKEGSLSDVNIMKIVPSIKGLLDVIHPSYFICDSHDLNAREFTTYPLHCVKNTEESQVITELQPYVKNTILKNSTNAFHSAKVKSFIENELNLYKDIVVVGCCSDICILQFALSLNTYLNEHELKDKRVIVPINMIETYHIPGVHDSMKWNEIACDLMLANAIEVVELK